jgi:hypothetical protein
MDNLKIIRRAANLNDNRTLVIHPASTIFSEYSSRKKDELKVPDNMIRLSAGIEDAWLATSAGFFENDIKQAPGRRIAGTEMQALAWLLPDVIFLLKQDTLTIQTIGKSTMN